MSRLVYLMEDFMPTAHVIPASHFPTTASQLIPPPVRVRAQFLSPIYQSQAIAVTFSCASSILFAWQQFLFNIVFPP